MRIFRHYDDIPDASRGAVVPIGNFDGVHRGHRALVAHAKSLAGQQSAETGVLAFEPHPQEFFHRTTEPFRLTPFRSKARLLADADVDIMYALAFDAEMATKSAEDFVRGVLVQGLGVRTVIVGADFRFGYKRAGDTELLASLARQCGFTVEIFEPVIAHDQQKISSTEIRSALKNAQPEEAARLLGHWWTIEARVEHGEARGRLLGFPTANMRFEDYLRPAFGIYAVRVMIMEDDRAAASHVGVANIGIRPMFESKVPLVEAHLFDFAGDLYGKHLAVELRAYLRPEIKFDDIEALKTQMALDCAQARQILSGQ